MAIDGYINRFLDVLGEGYNFVVTQSSVVLLPEDMKTRSGKRQYLAQVTGELTVHGPALVAASVRSGVGADVSHDPDKAVKTAQAEAFKKAAHQYGVALELWDPAHRKSLDLQRRVESGSEAALKQATFEIAKERLGKTRPSAKEVAELFGLVDPGELSDPDVLRRILAENDL